MSDPAPSPWLLCWINRPGGDLVYHVREDVTLGRAPECEIVVDEDGVSRRHCRLEVAEAGLHLVDLGSTNGTFVNGARVNDRWLAAADHVLVGRASFEVRGPADRPDRPAGGNATQVVGAETIQVALRAAEADDAALLRPDARVAEHLQTLCEVIEAINGGDSPDELHPRILNLLGRTLGVQFGAIVLGSDPSADPVAVFPGPSDRRPSQTVLHRVLAGEAILAVDPAADDQFSGSASLAGQSLSGILCAPITRHGDILGALYLTCSGAAVGWSEADLRLVSIVGRAVGLASENLRRHEILRAETATLRAQVGGAQQIIGTSAAIGSAIGVSRRAAQADVTVLLTGETGTGKELFARAIHAWSGRAKRPFVALNCGAIPKTMVESELFGHERGSFTGAVERRIGRFEMADGGTLFLDEIGELPSELQVKLLRVLEDKRFYRVGGSREIQTDVRILAATNRDLEERVKEGAFREDLLYRIRVLEIRIPPLRERGDDVIEIAEHLLGSLSGLPGQRTPELSAAAKKRLREYPWPGNVRELRNILERALILCSSDTIGPDEVLPAARSSSSSGGVPTGAGGLAGPGNSGAVPCALKDLEREHIRAVLESTGWNKSRSAEILGIGRTNIYEKIKQYDLKPDP